jgi:hypothetical protein
MHGPFDEQLNPLVNSRRVLASAAHFPLMLFLQTITPQCGEHTYRGCPFLHTRVSFEDSKIADSIALRLLDFFVQVPRRNE